MSFFKLNKELSLHSISKLLGIVNKQLSSRYWCTSEIHIRSILGMIFVNDIIKLIISYLCIIAPYVNDINVLITESCFGESVYKLLIIFEIILKWIQKNMLFSNIYNTLCFLFRTSHIVGTSSEFITLNSSTVVDLPKYSNMLDLKLDCCLNWKKHINALNSILFRNCHTTVWHHYVEVRRIIQAKKHVSTNKLCINLPIIVNRKIKWFNEMLSLIYLVTRES